MKFVKYGCFGLTFFSVLLFVVGILVSGYGKAKSGADASVARIPKNATNVEYYIPPPFYPMGSAEFDIDYPGYVEWVKSWKTANNKLSDISKTNITVTRYNPNLNNFERIDVKNGSMAYWRYTDQAMHLVYDHDKGRAYYWYSTR